MSDDDTPSPRLRRDPHARQGRGPRGVTAPVQETTSASASEVSEALSPEVIPDVQQPPETTRLRRAPASLRRGRSGEPGSRSAVREVVIVDDSAWQILAFPDLEAGALSATDEGMLGAARLLADELSGALVVAIFAASTTEIRFDAGKVGVDRLVTFVDDRFGDRLAERRVDAAIAVIEALRPVHVLFPGSERLGAELARRVASRVAERPAFDVVRLSANELICQPDGEAQECVRPLVRFIVPRPASFALPASGPLREARSVEPPRVTPAGPVQDGGLLAADPATISLGEADLIVSAGSGVSDWASFHALAATLGAAEGGSRVVCDKGDLPRSRQVGASGSIVRPKCYIALGISGASQHLDGIADCRLVIAVNTDRHANIMARADLAIVADAQDIMRALLDRAGRTAA